MVRQRALVRNRGPLDGIGRSRRQGGSHLEGQSARKGKLQALQQIATLGVTGQKGLAVDRCKGLSGIVVLSRLHAAGNAVGNHERPRRGVARAGQFRQFVDAHGT